MLLRAREEKGIKEINLIINSIPNLLQYFVPGYCGIFIFTYLSSKKINSKIKTIMACVVSYVLISLIHIVNVTFIDSELFKNALFVSGVATVISTILSVCMSMLFLSQKVKSLMLHMLHKSPNDDIWRDIFDYNKGSNLKVYLKDKSYYIIGHYKLHEEKDNESWFALSAFSKHDKTTNKNYNNEPDFSERDDIIIAIRLSDIEQIEVF